ncbi:MAG: Hsp70 family protein [Chloroflexi bacterium]|nr:Hsp70 family protein [Chloroflexota bacterium]
MAKVAVDFGTTNTIAAVWRDALDAPETIRLEGLANPIAGEAPLIPSLLYVEDGSLSQVVIGHGVRAQGYDLHGDERFFSSFKRTIAARNRPLSRTIDGSPWDERRAGEVFLQRVLRSLLDAEQDNFEELVLTVPVQSFEQYLKWLRDETSVFDDEMLGVQRLRIVDESTAAALGYDVRTPGALVLVFDFGGGTLDVSLVQMPTAEEGRGVLIRGERDTRGRASYQDQPEARVLAKAGRILGGDDIDHWLLDELLLRNEVDRSEIGDAYNMLKNACEQAKIRLSDHESAEISVFDPDTYRTYRATLTRTQFEEILDRHEFFDALQKTLNKALRAARARGIFPEDVSAVLMIGGSSLIPSVQRTVRTFFGSERVMMDRPFEAVAHGALSLTVGLGIDDFLYHSYAVRHLSPITLRHEWEEIIPAGTRYPLDDNIKLTLTASRDGQQALELVIGEIEDSAGTISEVMFGDRSIFMVEEGGTEIRQVNPLNDEDGSRTVAVLNPPGKAGEDRVDVLFDVDQNRTLRVTVTDLANKKILLKNTPVVELR